MVFIDKGKLGEKIPRSQIIREIIHASKNLNIFGNDLIQKLKGSEETFVKKETDD